MAEVLVVVHMVVVEKVVTFELLIALSGGV